MRHAQRGVSLFVSLVMLALLTLLGTATLNGSIAELRISGNSQQIVDSVQKADAGIDAVMSLVDTAFHPFNGTNNTTPFAGIPSADLPLKNIADVAPTIALSQSSAPCPRVVNASSVSQVSCEYYEVTSNYAPTSAGVSANLREGVRRQVIATQQ